MQTNLLTTKQAAAHLNVSAAFLERDRWAGAKVPFVRVGARSIRYRMTDLNQYIESRSFISTSEYTSKPTLQG
ncbi:helix-turn-helix domain-containing protein [uncultured Pseudoteredinibacter sp.]|uniref:helix-turn-helix domain-containing protein n=1 Tax=uncultured Pseudoteredinibacter sp. TaxID=1641701 RepID=UPI00261729E2|nr:helix-turn-helix domain-containing protein [uncultured Pseudoteredinibacter sp.]